LPVLIRGESGTGKELVAGAIQRLSGRRGRRYQTINCGDLNPELLRSELFGHERGAFTGAVGKTEGLLPRMDGGTVFFDEIGELPPRAQTMLLRFLQSGEGLAVGATGSTRVDVRVGENWAVRSSIHQVVCPVLLCASLGARRRWWGGDVVGQGIQVQRAPSQPTVVPLRARLSE